MVVNPFEIYSDKKNTKLKVRRHRELESIDAVSTKADKGGVSLNLPATNYGMKAFIFCLVLVFLVLLSRIFYLQIVRGDYYFNQAEGNRIYTEVKRAARGVIYSKEGDMLVKNIPNFRLVADGQQIRFTSEEERQQIIELIQQCSENELAEIENIINDVVRSGQREVFREYIPYEEALKLMIELESITGVNIEIYYGREYVVGEAFSHILGYTAKLTDEEYQEFREAGYLLNDEIGKMGLEKFYENKLRGENGYKKIEVDHRGRQKTVISDTNPQPGNNIFLTIDSELQNFIYQQLQDYIDKQKLSGAVAIALDPRDGSVLALVSVPSFNNNSFAVGISNEEYSQLINDPRKPLFNRSIAGEYPSGSTFKPVVAAAALEQGLINSSTSFLSTGGIQIDQYFYPDWKAGGHGQTNVTKALAESVNTFFYYIGGGDNETNTGLGVSGITEYARKFGLGSPTGIDLFGEQDGFLPTREWKEEFKDEAWYIGDTYHLAIGQGDILVTPLQVANYTAMIANGGVNYQPHIVNYITNQQGEIIHDNFITQRSEQVVSADTLSVVRGGMREAVISGSARMLQSLSTSVAGKTGTAQFGNEDRTHSWFTCFAPYETPEIVLTVIVEEGGEGNEAALPLSKTILSRYFQ